jgi:hypothetical protein
MQNHGEVNFSPRQSGPGDFGRNRRGRPSLSQREALRQLAAALCPPQDRSNNRILKYGQEYATQAMEEYEARMLDTLKRKAAVMGFQLSPPPTE